MYWGSDGELRVLISPQCVMVLLGWLYFGSFLAIGFFQFVPIKK